LTRVAARFARLESERSRVEAWFRLLGLRCDRWRRRAGAVLTISEDLSSKDRKTLALRFDAPVATTP
jgi:hypothetical protein